MTLLSVTRSFNLSDVVPGAKGELVIPRTHDSRENILLLIKEVLFCGDSVPMGSVDAGAIDSKLLEEHTLWTFLTKEGEAYRFYKKCWEEDGYNARSTIGAALTLIGKRFELIQAVERIAGESEVAKPHTGVVRDGMKGVL